MWTRRCRKVEFDLINRQTLEARVQLDLDVAVGREKVVLECRRSRRRAA